MELKKATPVRLRDLGLDERWLQDRIEEDPAILGIGDVNIVRREKTQTSGGRIDFLMYDPDRERRYEVEVMLGALDASHIIRTIEYWDVERQRFPAYDHRAVIVAEEITSRFFNVIRLLNRAVPIIALHAPRHGRTAGRDSQSPFPASVRGPSQGRPGACPMA